MDYTDIYFRKGESYSMTFTKSGLAAGVTIVSATLAVKTDPAATPIVSKSITTTLTGSGKVTNNGDATATINFLLSTTDTNLFSNLQYRYIYTITLTDSAGGVQV